MSRPRLIPGSFSDPSISSSVDGGVEDQFSFYGKSPKSLTSSLGQEMAQGYQSSFMESRGTVLSPIVEVDSVASSDAAAPPSLPSDASGITLSRHARVESYYSTGSPLSSSPPSSDRLMETFRKDTYRPCPVSYEYAARHGHPNAGDPDPVPALSFASPSRSTAEDSVSNPSNVGSSAKADTGNFGLDALVKATSSAPTSSVPTIPTIQSTTPVIGSSRWVPLDPSIPDSAQGDFDAIFNRRSPFEIPAFENTLLSSRTDVDSPGQAKHTAYLLSADSPMPKDLGSPNSVVGNDGPVDAESVSVSAVNEKIYNEGKTFDFENPDDKIADLDTRLNRLSLQSPSKASLPQEQVENQGKHESPMKFPTPCAFVSTSPFDSPRKVPLPQSPLSNVSHMQEMQRQARSSSRTGSPFVLPPPPLFPLSMNHPDGIKTVTPASRNSSPIRVYPENPALSPVLLRASGESPTRSPRKSLQSLASQASTDTMEVNVEQTLGHEPILFPDFDIDRLTVYPPQIYSKADVIATPGDPESVVPPTMSELRKSSGEPNKNRRDVLVNMICAVAIVTVIGLSFYFSRVPLALTKRSFELDERSMDYSVPMNVMELQHPVRVTAFPVNPNHNVARDLSEEEELSTEETTRNELQKREKYRRPTECTVEILHHEFAWSYGKPFVGQYTPPPCSYTHVYFNISTTSTGLQFDRLALLFFDDVEIWRTSTAEPTEWGIIFGYSKDMTPFANFLRRPAKIIFDLGNLVDDYYTGKFDVTITATFYSPYAIQKATPAHQILPVSAQRSHENGPSQFSFPNERAVSTVRIPKNTIRAILSVSASGNGGEEFWYTCILNSLLDTFNTPKGVLCGNSAFREIQIYIDGVLVGAQWPYTTIYTGGLSPLLWRPVVSFGTYDVKEYEFDITTWLPMIVSKEVEIEIKVVGWDDEKGLVEVGSDWLISGRVFLWKDRPDWKTKGINHGIFINDPQFHSFKTVNKDAETGKNSSLSYSLTGVRLLSSRSTIYTSRGPVNFYTKYDLHCTLRTTMFAGSLISYIDHNTHGSYSISAAEGRFEEAHDWDLHLITSFHNGNGHLTRKNEVRGNTAKGIIFDATYGAGFTSYLREMQDGAVLVSADEWKDHNAKGTASTEFRGSMLHNETVYQYSRLVKSEGLEVVGDDEVVNEVKVRRGGVPVPGVFERPKPVSHGAPQHHSSEPHVPVVNTPNMGRKPIVGGHFPHKASSNIDMTRTRKKGPSKGFYRERGPAKAKWNGPTKERKRADL